MGEISPPMSGQYRKNFHRLISTALASKRCGENQRGAEWIYPFPHALSTYDPTADQARTHFKQCSRYWGHISYLSRCMFWVLLSRSHKPLLCILVPSFLQLRGASHGHVWSAQRSLSVSLLWREMHRTEAVPWTVVVHGRLTRTHHWRREWTVEAVRCPRTSGFYFYLIL